MTPAELKEWYYAIRDILQDALPNRDSRIWSYLWTACLVLVTTASTKPDMLPAGWADVILHWSAMGGMVAGKMGWSWSGSPKSDN